MTKKLFFLISILLVFKISGAKNYNANLNDATPPTIFNFRIEASEPNRVYFDSDKIITGSSTNGFTVSNKSISGITINEGQLSNHYFKVSSSFSYWDNNTIRYEGGSDLKDSNNNSLIEFTLSYIKNNIPEPQTSKDRYVTTSANGGGDGITEGSAWTLSEAFSKANAGMTVWIKAGNYGNQNLALYNDGTASNPIKFIGYKNSKGDISSNYFDYGVNWNTSEMPTLTGASASDGHAIQLMGTNYVVFRNLQITNYYQGIRANNTHNSNLVFDRINGKLFGKNSTNASDVNATFINFATYVSSGSGSYRPFTSNDFMKFLDCRSLNANMGGFTLFGKGNNLIDGCKSYNDRTGMNERQDYHISVNGHNNIIRNCYAENFNTTSTNAATHGIGIRGSSNLDNDYNLIELSKGVNLNESFYIRNYGCDYNVIKDCYAGNNANAFNHKKKEHSGAVYLWGGVSNNIIERVISNEVSIAIGFIDNNEEGNTNDKSIGYNNIIRNCVFNGHRFGIYINGYSGSALHNNKIINTTFNDGTFLLRDVSPNADIKNLEIINTNFSNFSQEANYFPLTGAKFSNSNFYNFKSSWKPSGNNISVDPKFVNVGARDFLLQSDSKLIDAGERIDDNKYDILNNYRLNDSSPDIGAYEYKNNTTGYINANAGFDVEICQGSETILNATGNGNFLWSTGETTASITVSPDKTTTYTVIVSNENNSESDEVIVTVNELPEVTLGDDINSCLGTEVTLEAVGKGEFLWSTGETGASINVNPMETTSYIVTSTIQCGNENLSISDTIVVNINAELIVTAGADVSSCSGAEVILTAEGGAGDFLWNTGETTASITVIPTETSTYTVTSSNGDCTVSDNVIVTIIEEPEVNLGDDLTICYGNEATLNAEGNGNFLWSTGETTASINVNPLETTEYIVTASVNCGSEILSVSDTIIVNVTPELVLNVSDNVAFCNPQEVTLTATSNAGVLWSTGETANSIIVNPTETTTYTVTTSLGECSLEEAVTVTIAEQPTVDLGNDISICSGNEVTLTAQGKGAFLWSTGSTNRNIKVSPAETTEYIVTASIDCGTEVLSVTDTIVVNVIPGVILSVSNDVITCAGSEIMLTAKSNANYLWSTGETTASITVNPTETTTYTVTAGSGDCALTEEIIVTVEEAPEVELGNDKTICFGEEVVLTAEGVGAFLWNTGETTASITVSPSETKTYSITATTNCGGNDVSVSDEIIVNVFEGPSLSVSDDVTICSGSEVTLTAEGNGDFLWSTGENTSSITVSPTQTTTYTVTSSSGSCSKTEDVIVTVEVMPTVDLGEDISICYGDDVFLTAEGNGDFLWSNGQLGPSIKVSPLVTTTYSVSASSGCGNTTVTDEITVFVGPQIFVDAGEDKLICTGELVTLTAKGNGDFLWNTGETTASITVSPDSPTTYLVTSTIGGCSVFDEVVVLVESSPEVSLGDDKTICSGESVTLIAEGIGNYLWNTGEVTSSITVSPTKTTTYSIIASSHCNSDAVDEITVFVNDAVKANAGNDVSIEPGETVTLTATGGNSFLWNTGETTASITVQPENTTTYTVEVENGTSCSSTDDVKVTVENIPLIINNGEDITICKGDELILQARGSSNYLWSTSNMESTITVNPEETTIYTVSAQKNGILETVDVLVIVEDCSNKRAVEYNVYPNPTDGLININIPSLRSSVKIVVTALNGKVIYQKEVKADNNGVFTQLNLSHMANGVYLIKMYNDNFNETKKVIVI
ncbi:T9SS type A sorting domain-containing protein [Aureibaculum sp. 2210JD6-5]|uniref:T9SS type A sorting domain-containing protein n=1 Tax=Aureibaculum sp. 2210JD6-5 TaxID=3103957 RepID=UPI002AADD9C1|nr:T9SS type A sorting domain-containing protein [Aureibaculum sp. 2210JD6-5]MDY7394014.1 T9SS type A sorting domain-containing protein [Aureibaculum sp. 2210JD6-5]